MHAIDTGRVIVSDTPDFIECSQQGLSHSHIVHLDEFIPDGKSAVFTLQSRNLSMAEDLFRHIDARAKAQSIITGRLAKGEGAPQNLLRNKVLIPWCDDETYRAWLQFLLGFPGIVPSPAWLFAQNRNVLERDEIQRLKTVLHNLMLDEICELNAEMLAQRYPYSRTSLAHYCRMLYGVPAGMLCRVWRVFTRTSVYMQEEQMLLPDGRYGRSPIGCLDGDYLNSLERVTGLRYTDLRLATQHDHWVAVWMRGWGRQKEKDYRQRIGSVQENVESSIFV